MKFSVKRPSVVSEHRYIFTKGEVKQALCEYAESLGTPIIDGLTDLVVDKSRLSKGNFIRCDVSIFHAVDFDD